jgi:heat shock protein HslJ
MKDTVSYMVKALIRGSIIGFGINFFVSQTSADELKGTKWRLVKFTSMDDATGIKRPSDPSLYSMTLKRDGSVHMHLNCNYANGTWSATPSSDGMSGQFTFGPLAVTRAMCPPPSMDQHIVSQAQYIRGYLLKDGKLHLSLMADGGIYTWEPDTAKKTTETVYASPEEGGPRNWEVTGFSNDRLNLREQPSTKAKIIDKYALGTILDNLGCKTNERQVWCDVQKLGGGARGYVSAKFLKPAVSPDGSAVTGEDDSALRAGQGKFDATGTVLCAFSKGDTMRECAYGVARAGGGYATVVITKPDGITRAIFFRMGKAMGADTSQADGYPEFSSSKEGDWNFIHVGDEFYKIPDAVILGG